MKNHFFFAYTGNKRGEIDEILDTINIDNINNIIEPFCGSSAISFAIWLKHGNKYNYYLNDNDNELILIYELFKTKTIDHISEELDNINNKISNKEEWNDYFKNAPNNTYKELYFRKYSQYGKKGFYPLNRPINKYKLSNIQLSFIDFIKSPNVHITNNDWFNIFNEFKDDNKSLFILDPPYIDSNNDYYINKTINVYEYFYKNNFKEFKSHIYLILEDIWVVRLLFENKIIKSYGKKYELSKKKTSHIIIYNHK